MAEISDIDVDEILEVGLRRGASDVHLKVGNQPMLRIDGQLRPMVEKRKLIGEDTTAISNQIMTLKQKKVFKEKHEVDLAYSLSGVGRFRVSVFQQRGTIGMVFRTIHTRIRNFEELYLPPALARLAMEPRGLILVTGSTGSGKSTTLAAIIEEINLKKTAHIITIEDPIEYLFKDRRCIINQREVGSDTNTFAEALRSALRQDPDIIMVGEMRDFDTIQTALTAAETGHLVLSTLHTVDALETINRIISVFPPHQHEQVRLQLSSVLKGVVSQRLLPRKDGKGRVPAVEVLIATALVRECVIDKAKTHLIFEAMRQGVSQYGMQTFDQALYYLVKRGLVSYEVALHNSTSPTDFALRFKGIESAGDEALRDMEVDLQAPKGSRKKKTFERPQGIEGFTRFGEEEEDESEQESFSTNNKNNEPEQIDADDLGDIIKR